MEKGTRGPGVARGHVDSDRPDAVGAEIDPRPSQSHFVSSDFGLFEAVPDATIVADSTGRIAFANRRAQLLFGYGDGELIGESISILVPDGIRGDHPHHVQSYFDEPSSRDLAERDDLVGRRKDGSDIAVDISLSPWRTADGVVAIASIRDTSRQRAAEVALQHSEEFLRLSQKVARIGSWESWPDTGQVRWSPEVYELLGIRQGGFDERQDTVVRMVHPDDIDRVLAHGREAAPEGRREPIEYRIVRPDGAVRTVRAESIAQPDQDGRLRIVGTLQDLTEQKEAEALLSEAQTMSAQLVDQSLLGISIVQDGRLVFVNSTLAKFSGYTPEEMLARSDVLETVVEEDHETVKKSIAARLADPSAQVRYTTRVRRKDGQIVHMEVHGGQVQYKGRPALIAAALDVTDRTRLQEQMHHVQKMELVGRLAGGIAHDFNNVLTMVTGHCEALARKLGPEGSHVRNVAAIQRAVDRAAALTRQLLSFGRRVLAEPKIVDVNQIVTSLQHLLPRIIGEQIETVVTVTENLGPVRVDPGQIEQVILNLVMNARDAMPDGGTVRIESAQVEHDAETAAWSPQLQPGPYVTLTVSDTGCGMDDSTRRQIFEPFFTTKEVGQGVGLGLSTVYGIVVQSGGAITVNSELGRGSSFTIHLPVVDGEAAPVADNDAEGAGPPGTETLLVVEDEEEILEIVRQTLGELGYTVLSAASGPDALELLSAHDGSLDLLVTDVVMPHMGGDELARQITKRYPDMRVLFMSGYADDVLGRHGTLEPGVVLLRKPFSALELARTVRDLIDAT